MFGKRSLDAPRAPEAPPPAPAGGTDIATRPQKVDPAARAAAPAPKPAAGREVERTGPKATAGFEQLRAAQSGNAKAAHNPIAEIVREQSDYYHATKMTIYTA